MGEKMQITSTLRASRWLCPIVLLSFTSFASAYLGGIESADGYQTGPTPPFSIDPYLADYYTAGHYATNNGGPGGSPTAIPVGSALWQELNPTTNGYDLAAT